MPERDWSALTSVPRRQCREPEPAWHSRARKQRSQDRMVARLAAACVRLSKHHGSAVPNVLRGFARQAHGGDSEGVNPAGKGGKGDNDNTPGDGGMGVAARTMAKVAGTLARAGKGIGGDTVGVIGSPSVQPLRTAPPNCSPNAAAFCESGKGGKGDNDHTPGDGGMGVAASTKAKEAGTHARAGKGIGGDTVGVDPAGMVGKGDSDKTPGDGGMDGTALDARTHSRSAPEAFPREPLEFPLGGNMDLAAIRVKVQRLSDELAAALVSLEELVLVPTAVVRDADCQTEMVSVAVPTPINTDLSAAERAGALVNIVDEVQRHLVQVQGFMATSSNIQSDWVHVRKKLAVAVDGVKLSMESWKRMT